MTERPKRRPLDDPEVQRSFERLKFIITRFELGPLGKDNLSRRHRTPKVKDIFALKEEGVDATAIAERLGISRGAVYRVLSPRETVRYSSGPLKGQRVAFRRTRDNKPAEVTVDHIRLSRPLIKFVLKHRRLPKQIARYTIRHKSSDDRLSNITTREMHDAYIQAVKTEVADSGIPARDIQHHNGSWIARMWDPGSSTGKKGKVGARVPILPISVFSSHREAINARIAFGKLPRCWG